MSKNDVMTRIEEDRERHKRLRERRWVQPISYAPSASNPNHMPLASFLPLSSSKGSGGLSTSLTAGADDELPLDIEFENDWETTSDWNEDDEEIVSEEREMCFPREGEEPMDLS
jgi:CTD kinase subunit gamma